MTTQTEARPLDAAFLEELEANAVRFAYGAGEIVLGHFRTALTVEYKSHGHTSPVTVADRESEEYLRKVITDTYPTHSILGEEGEDLTGTGDGFTWVLDPVDGTANFISGLPLFAVSIGVLYQGEPVAAAIFVPTSSLLQTGVYHARKGHPTFLDDTPVRVATQPAPQRSKLAGLPGLFTQRMRFTGELRKAHGEPRTLGTVAVELALAASGTLQYVFFNRPKIWDVAAGVLLVKQAGGLVLVQNRSHQPWLPLNRFEVPPGKGPELERMRGWGQRIVAANPEMAWFVAGGLQSRPNFMRPVGALVKKASQLPLLRNGH